MMYGPNDYGDGVVTIEDLEDMRRWDECRDRMVARDAVLDIAEQIWCEREGWAESWEGVVDGEFSRGYIFHPPTHGGWVMVPESPDENMLLAAHRQWFAKRPILEACRAIYAAMCAAAPSAPVGG